MSRQHATWIVPALCGCLLLGCSFSFEPEPNSDQGLPEGDGQQGPDLPGVVDTATPLSDTTADQPAPPPDALPPLDSIDPGPDSTSAQPDAGLPCDSGFTVPGFGVVDEILAVSFTDTVAHLHIGLALAGPGSPVASYVNDAGSNPPISYTWNFIVTDLAAGVLTMQFTKDKGKPVASCQRLIKP